MKKLSNKELVVLAKEGNERALSILLGNLRPTMIMAMKRSFKPQFSDVEIEDAVQDSMLKAFTNLDKYKPQHSFSSWLSRICNNTIIDKSRKAEKKAIKFSLDVDNDEDESSYSIANTLFDEHMNPEDAMMKKQESEFAYNILEDDNIPESLRDVATLRYIYDKTYDEIVNELCLPLGTVKSRIKRFKEKAFDVTKKAENYKAYAHA